MYVCVRQLTSRVDRSSIEITTYLIQLSGRIGELTCSALSKIKERIYVIRTIQSLQNQLAAVIKVENETREAVEKSQQEKKDTKGEIDSLQKEQTQLSEEVAQMKTKSAQLQQQQIDTKQKIVQEEEQTTAALATYEEKNAVIASING